jgi:hypothetical protein
MKRSLMSLLAILSLWPLSVEAIAGKAASYQQFDMICRIYGRPVVVNKPGRLPDMGYFGLGEWTDVLRFAIDLRAMRYQGTNWIKSGPENIALFSKGKIYFGKSNEGIEFIHIRTKKYYSYTNGVGTIDEVQSG